MQFFFLFVCFSWRMPMCIESGPIFLLLDFERVGKYVRKDEKYGKLKKTEKKKKISCLFRVWKVNAICYYYSLILHRSANNGQTISCNQQKKHKYWENKKKKKNKQPKKKTKLMWTKLCKRIKKINSIGIWCTTTFGQYYIDFISYCSLRYCDCDFDPRKTVLIIIFSFYTFFFIHVIL